MSAGTIGNELATASADVRRAMEFWAQHDKGAAHPIMEQDVWAALARDQEVIIVHGVREGTTKYGDTWFSDVELSEDSDAILAGEPRFLTAAQSKNQVRDRLLSALRDAIAAGGPMPATLTTFETDMGLGWDFSPPPVDYFAALGAGDVQTAGDGDLSGQDETTPAGGDDAGDVPF